MTGSPNRGDAAAPSPAPAKSPAPDLSGRAPRPPVVRLRRAVVQLMVIAAAVLVAGSLAWAFVVQPELRAAARTRAVDGRETVNRGPVRPAEVVTDQPASYDRLPEPRTAAPEPVDTAAALNGASGGTRRPSDAAAHGGRAEGPSPSQLAARSSLFFDDGAPVRTAAPAPLPRTTAPPTAEGSGAARDDDGVYNPHRLSAPRSPYELKAGSIVSAVLLTGVDTSRPGPVIATVTQNIYDTVTGRRLLAPQGSRLLGRHEGDSRYGDRKAFLAWERLILPNGKSLVLDAEPGVDAQGATGVQGRVDRRIGALVTGTLFAGAITTLGQMARDEGGRGGGSFLGDAGDAAAIEGARVGGRLIDRELEVRPAIRIQAGGLVRVLVTRDLILEPYRAVMTW
ncbi:TrbI/VirB10 family protein [Brevundimonas sp.]|jgi:type IV secretory pathway VirB10-like protein|uniref:TrbI/VirB10 family protein n=1 Tax=Brevundimonas sp. TaxID=1871086 RepID=UPI0037BF4EAD